MIATKKNSYGRPFIQMPRLFWIVVVLMSLAPLLLMSKSWADEPQTSEQPGNAEIQSREQSSGHGLICLLREILNFRRNLAEAIGSALESMAPASMPPIFMSGNLAIRAALPLADDETASLLQVLLRSESPREWVDGCLVDDVITDVEKGLQRRWPDATVRPRHLAIHMVVNVGAENIEEAGIERERDTDFGVIRTSDLRDPLQLLKSWTLTFPDEMDEDSLASVFEDRDAVRRLLNHPHPEKRAEFTMTDDQAITVTFVGDFVSDPAFVERDMAADDVESAKSLITNWLEKHPTRLNFVLTYEIVPDLDAASNDGAGLRMETVERQFEFDGKHWSAKPSK